MEYFKQALWLSLVVFYDGLDFSGIQKIDLVVDFL
jgi:hypothetical protein